MPQKPIYSISTRIAIILLTSMWLGTMTAPFHWWFPSTFELIVQTWEPSDAGVSKTILAGK